MHSALTHWYAYYAHSAVFVHECFVSSRARVAAQQPPLHGVTSACLPAHVELKGTCRAKA